MGLEIGQVCNVAAGVHGAGVDSAGADGEGEAGIGMGVIVIGGGKEEGVLIEFDGKPSSREFRELILAKLTLRLLRLLRLLKLLFKPSTRLCRP